MIFSFDQLFLLLDTGIRFRWCLLIDITLAKSKRKLKINFHLFLQAREFVWTCSKFEMYAQMSQLQGTSKLEIFEIGLIAEKNDLDHHKSLLHITFTLF